MKLPTRLSIAGLLAAVIALPPVHAALADGLLMPPAFDASKLVIFDDSLFTVRTDPSVSMDATRTEYVRKIEFGRTSTVKVTTTASGTYSTDGLYSPHIRYPGIHVERLTGQGQPVTNVAFWSDRSGWVVAPLLDAGSILVLGN